MTDRYELTRIGTIELGIDGSDEYLLVRDLEGTVDADDVYDALIARFYRESSHAGGYFCRSLRVMPDPYYTTQCVVVVQHRYDV